MLLFGLLVLSRTLTIMSTFFPGNSFFFNFDCPKPSLDLGHLSCHKNKFEPYLLGRFDVYWIQTDKPAIDWMITTCGVQDELSWLAPKL